MEKLHPILLLFVFLVCFAYADAECPNILLIARWPKRVKAGIRYDGLVSLIDLVPTFCDLAGAGTYEALDRKSLRMVFESDGAAELHEEVFSEMGYARGVKTKKWKYIAVRYPEVVQRRINQGAGFRALRGGENEYPYLMINGHLGYFAARENPRYFEVDQLYNLETDSKEEINLADQNPEIVKAMKAKLKKYLKTFEEGPFGEFSP